MQRFSSLNYCGPSGSTRTQQAAYKALKNVHGAYARGEIYTKREAKRMALAGIPIWAFLVRIFIKMLIDWAWDELTA